MRVNLRRLAQNGFTLIELIAGIVVFAVSLTIVTGLVASQSRQSIDPIWQVKGIELGQSLLNEINAKAFDENSDRAGGNDRCNELVTCSVSANLGVDSGEVRESFDDVDDFHGLDATGDAIKNSLGETIAGPDGNFYQGFRARVSVFYDDNADGINDDDLNQDGTLDTGVLVGNQKLIRIVITTPGGDDISFSSFRTNF
ncbi:prepilin-type N-terminal cleavage/methylation domain-containing protein [Alteromonas sp. ASW11-36]|uniref:Prepilin-type N-terminal cleavage/methylation domain-containing protein n=1 Tax=Alteromonas arenosi TaxID=3055817 RepID=A0ABT7SSH7_9ALTE|nr:prepilin-type N-terminal cleavage/methylation domain-containing protein [Alteromonas sp. ASW11-36]MDM7859137.1 prepilin-type N-terminal cleavage/methylation domain-containing protein [Alteromonas sp. ASW11-36]